MSNTVTSNIWSEQGSENKKEKRAYEELQPSQQLTKGVAVNAAGCIVQESDIQQVRDNPASVAPLIGRA